MFAETVVPKLNRKGSTRSKYMKSKNSAQITPKFYALGGLGEVGANMYCFELSDEIIIFDVGIAFPKSKAFNIKYLLPNFDSLPDKKIHLVITHCHEDHIGGLKYFLKSQIFA